MGGSANKVQESTLRVSLTVQHEILVQPYIPDLPTPTLIMGSAAIVE